MDLVEVDTIEVVLEEDEPPDEFLALLREIALEAIALRAHSPGDPRVEVYDDPAPEPVEPNPAVRLVRRLGRRGLVLVAVVAALALAAGITPGVLQSRRAAADLAALQAEPGVLEPVSDPPAEQWRTPGRVVGDRAGALLVAGMGDGSLRRVDPATGATIWAIPSDAAPFDRCFPVGEAAGSAGPPADGVADPQVLVACVAAPAQDPSSGTARVVVLDVADGAVALTVPVPGTLLAAEPLDGDLLVVARLADGRLGAARWDVAAGAPRWEYASAAPVDPAATGTVEVRTQSLSVAGLAVDLTTGEARDAQDALQQPFGLEEYTLPGGERATWWWYGDGTSGQGQVVGDHGMRTVALLGPPLVPELTDGSRAATLVTAVDADRLRGLDLRAGRLRWLAIYPGAATVRAAVQVDGVMVLDGGASVDAIDVDSGAVLWSAQVDPRVTRDSALTDAEVVLLPERFEGAGSELVARRIADGAALWSTTMPAGTDSLTVVDRRLVASTGDEVVGLG